MRIVLVGREAETARVRRLVDSARRGHSDSLVLRGRPGVGKSALLLFAVEYGDGLTLLEARGVESESALPFAGLHELVRPLLSHIAALPAPQAAALRGALALAPSKATESRFAVYAAVLGLLAVAAESSPVLCLVDDAQWLDPESAEALMFAARRLDADAVALLFAARTDDATFEPPGLEELAVGALAPTASLELLAAKRTPIAPDVAQRLVRETDGNPLALLESARALTDDQLMGREPLVGPLPIGPSAERLFSSRIEALSPGARQALLVAAAAYEADLGPILDAVRILGGGPGGLEEAEAAGLVGVADARLSFSQPLVRSAVYAASPPADRRAAHRALADVLRDDRRAWHLAVSAFGPDEEIAQTLEAAAMAARRRTGFASAAAALDRAAALSEDSGGRARRMFLAADAARQAGQGERAVHMLEAAAECAEDGTLQIAIEHARGRVELLHGRTHAAQAILARAAQRIEDRDADHATAMLAEAAFAAMIGGDGPAAVVIAQKAQALRPGDGGLVDLVTGLVLGTALFRTGSVSEGLALVVRAAELAETSLDAGLEAEYVVHAAHVLAWVGEYRRARHLLDRVLRETRASGALGRLPWALYVSSDLDTRTGHWAAARADAWDASRIAADTANALWRSYALGCLAVLDAAQGREEECRANAAEAQAIARRLEIECPRKIADALGLLELGRGRPEEAIPHFENAGNAGSRLSLADLVEAYVRAQRPVPSAVRELLAEVRPSTPAMLALKQRCQGLLASDDDFEVCFADALDAYDDVGMPFARARTELCFGERLRRAGRRVDSRGYLRAAAQRFASLGATPWSKRAEQELRASGEAVQRPSDDGRDRLTPQELQVALVVARGVTNREAGATLFLSPKTIDYHLGRVYRKLGVGSRTQLAYLLADTLDPPARGM
jgi:DNA-binding CsgD family transcriptional regulator